MIYRPERELFTPCLAFCFCMWCAGQAGGGDDKDEEECMDRSFHISPPRLNISVSPRIILTVISSTPFP